VYPGHVEFLNPLYSPFGPGAAVWGAQGMRIVVLVAGTAA